MQVLLTNILKKMKKDTAQMSRQFWCVKILQLILSFFKKVFHFMLQTQKYRIIIQNNKTNCDNSSILNIFTVQVIQQAKIKEQREYIENIKVYIIS